MSGGSSQAVRLKVFRLPLRFDPARLQADLGAIAPGEWLPHFNKREHDGGWSGVALRSVAGRPALYPDPTARGGFADTELLARCGYVREILATFRCPLTSVRLLKLAAGSVIREHRDLNLGFEDGEVRLHVPITTHPDVAFFLAGERVAMAEGECWYLDFNLPHRVENRAPIDRIHLVIDCVLNDWLRGYFPPPSPPAGPTLSRQ